ncbi:MAG: hypothetical protein COA79_24520 [Planctomycetota bacterium]|nr:MAG: hypothetical protein COA79_24520 [Planctomycetota bacterium]
MSKKKLKILMPFDFPFDPATLPDENYGAHLPPEDWRAEHKVILAIKKCGHEAIPFAVHNKIQPLINKIRDDKPDVIFNMLECFDNDRRHESNFAGLLDLMGVPFTGCPPVSMTLCRNKFFTKRILAPHRIKFPKSVIFPLGITNRSLKKLEYPLFIKPLGQEGSDGITQSSFAETESACLSRVKFIHDSLEVDVLVEEYIEGREIYASVLGNDRLRVLPLREMIFSKFPEDKPKFATFKAKWDEDFRKKWGIKNTMASNIPEDVEKRIKKISRTTYKALGLSGYGRLDIRLTPDNEIYVIEVNPNPNVSDDDELALSAKKANIPYHKLIGKIINLALA